MAQKPGKKFEEDFINSVDKEFFVYRLKDAGGWSKSEETRFTISNMCDYSIMANDSLLPLELKSVNGTSMPFKNILGQNEKKGWKKVYEMVSSGTHAHANVYPFYVFNFRGVEKTYAVRASKVCRYMSEEIDKKSKQEKYRSSFSLEWLNENGTLIEQRKKVTRYTYQLGFLLWAHTEV